LTRRPYCVA